MTTVGVHKWHHASCGTHWIVTLPCVGARHDPRMLVWCEQNLGYVDRGVIRMKETQDFWFRSESDAVQFWLAWG